MNISPKLVRFDENSMWVELLDGRIIGPIEQPSGIPSTYPSRDRGPAGGYASVQRVGQSRAEAAQDAA